jgi:hypothetical protein
VRKLAYIVNTVFVIALLVMFVISLNGPQSNRAESLIFLLLLAIPLINFLAIAGSGKEKDFFSLYFERKRLEQEKKIAELKKSMGEET